MPNGLSAQRPHWDIGQSEADCPNLDLRDRTASYSEREQSLMMVQYSNMLHKMRRHWRFATTLSGIYCMVPLGSKGGDQVAVFRGGKVPMAIRLEASSGTSRQSEGSVVGPAYRMASWTGRLGGTRKMPWCDCASTAAVMVSWPENSDNDVVAATKKCLGICCSWSVKEVLPCRSPAR